MPGALLSTLDDILRDFYLPPFERQLKDDGYVHTCGTPYIVRAQNADGKVFRWVHGVDAWDAIIYLMCPCVECVDSLSSYIQGTLRINGKKLAEEQTFHSGSFLEALADELNGLFEDFEKELRTTR